jgi:hypothetical protein
MNLLRSPGLAAQPLPEISADFHRLHPKEVLHPLTSDNPEGWHHTNQTFDFVTGAWFAKQIRNSSGGTAVVQWGWDSREMWLLLCSDFDLINLISECWVWLFALHIP